MKKGYFCCLLLVILLATSLYGQNQHKNQSRGFNANEVFDGHDIDHINLFNGNLLLKIPVGNTYRVGGNLSYSFNLVYNSNLWTQKEVCISGANYNTDFFTVWGYTNLLGQWVPEPLLPGGGSPRDPSNDCLPAQYPNPATNAGMGWQLSLGRLYLPNADSSTFHPQTTERNEIVYQSPDGSEHAFFGTLHEGETGDPAEYFYSRDGSYLRLKKLSSQLYEVHFPNGVVHKFQPIASTAPASDVEYRITEMRDQFGNYVNISYSSTVWTISDSVGRSHIVSLSKIGTTEFQNVVTSIKLDAFNGSSATYFLNYFEKVTNRAQPHAPSNFQGIGQTDTLSVPYLTEIKLPGVNNGGYSIPQFATNSGLTEVLPAAYDFTGEFTSSTSPGMIRGIILPTGGAIKWKYSGREVVGGKTYGYVYPPASSGRNYLRFGVGVRERTLILRERSFTWKYDPEPETYESRGCANQQFFSRDCQGRLLTNTVTMPPVDGNPNGDYTKYYFSIFPYAGTDYNKRDLADWHIVEYGLPVNKFHSVTESLTGKPLFLSSEIFASNGVKKRSVYLRYETDKYPERDGYGSEREVNARVIGKRTIFHDDGNRYQETSYSDFDGLGHYRTAQYLSNFGYGDQRIEITRYNANSLPVNGNLYNSGNYAVDPATNQPVGAGSYNAFPSDARWILNTFSRKTSGDFIKRSTTFFSFNEYGQLMKKRGRKELETANTTYFYKPNDVMTVYQYSTAGNPAFEKFYGGDKKNNLTNGTYAEISQSNVFITPANEEYTLSYSYETCGGSQLGVVKSKEFLGLETGSYKNEDYDIDCNTGLVKISRDSAGVATQYFYDSLGRMTDIYNDGTPQTYKGEHLKIEYDDVELGSIDDSPAVEVIHKKRNGTAEETFDTEEYRYDQLGRISVEKVKMPGGVFSARYTNYNGMGWVTSVSEWLDHDLISNRPPNDPLVEAELNKKTSFSNFDPFGRAWRTTLPDQKVVQQQYDGIRQITRINSIRTSATSSTETEAIRKERYDQSGRLFQVVEPSSTIGTDVTTDYNYDVNGKLIRASTISPAGVNQIRAFEHDNLGNLTKEQLPEKSAASEYKDYDTLNNVGKSFDGAHWLVYTYDKSTRVSKIEELIGGTTRPFKDYSYYPANVGGNRGLGRLSSATRHNWITNPYESGSTTEFSVHVGEDYTYAGIGGRLSKRITKTNAANSSTPTFEQTFAYDPQGNLISQTYPRCTNTTCANSAGDTARPWTVNYTYQNGLLQTVGGGGPANSTAGANYASSVTYHINQTVNTIAHANGVTDTLNIDPKNMSRVQNIKAAKGAATLWNSGPYSYDGSGNITNIGTDWYLYDKVNRVVEGSAMKISNQRKQRYTYDAFGNQIQIDTYTFATPTGGALYKSFNPHSIAASNHYEDIVYDGAGNALGPTGSQWYTYDAANMMKYAPGYTYLYGPTDERVLIADRSNAPDVIETFVLRGLNNEVLREYKMQGGDALNNWHWLKDYIYAGSRLLASESHSGVGIRHYHLDHLGTPRVITNGAGVNINNQHYQYFAFGDDVNLGEGGISSLSPPEERLKFTGHEYSPDYAGQNLTYMHARFYKPGWGKFLSIDPARDWDLKQPQSWNLYTYAKNNPMRNIDPNGREAINVNKIGTAEYTFMKDALIRALSHKETRKIIQGADNSALRFGFLAASNSENVRLGNLLDQGITKHSDGSPIKLGLGLTQEASKATIPGFNWLVFLDSVAIQKYNKISPDGQKNLYHELYHVMQILQGKSPAEINSDKSHLDADAFALRILGENPDKKPEKAEKIYNQIF